MMVTNFISIFGFHMSTYILFLNSLIYLSNLFISPIVYELRIPEFKEASRLCCAVRREIKDSEGNTGRVTMAVDHIIMYSSLSNRKLWRIHNCDTEGVRVYEVSPVRLPILGLY